MSSRLIDYDYHLLVNIPQDLEVLMSIPAYLPYYVVGGTIAVIAAVLFGLNVALKRARWLGRERTSAVRSTALILIGWFAAAIVLASLGVYRGAPERIPTIQFGIVLPLIGAC